MAEKWAFKLFKVLVVAPLPPSFPTTGTYLGILHYKQAKLRKYMQHYVHT
jgi:hypothetical protein